MIITIGDQQFGPNIMDDDGTYWMITELDGWASPAVRAGSLERTSAHGAAPTTAYYSPRQMTAKGIVKAPTEALFWKAYNRLSGGLVDLNSPVAMTVQEDVLKRTDVVKAAETRLSFTGVGAIKFELPLTAYDPLKYGPETVASIGPGATRSIVNEGNEPSPWVIATASVTGTVSLKNNVAQQTVTTGTQAVEAGTVMDFRGRTLYAGDQNRYSRLHPTSTWWLLQTGANPIVNGGSTAMSVAYRPAWV